MGMKHIVLKIGTAGAKLLYLPLKGLKKRNRICILSRQGRTESVDILLVKEYLKNNHPEVECNVMVHFIEDGTLGKIKYVLHMFAQMRALATSKAVLLDGYCIPVCLFKHSSETKVVQMWHALAAMKKFGYQTIDKPDGHDRMTAEIMCMHRNYDYIICPGHETGRHFCSGFDADESKLVFLGLPRIDMIMKEEPELEKRIREEHNIEPEKEIVLYTPTFRKNSGVRIEEIVRAIDPEKQVLAVKFHPLYNEKTPEEMDGVKIISDSVYSSYEWLKACGRVITDYSALGIEASLLNKPLYFFVYDIDEYEKNVGLNINPVREMPHVSALTGEQLKKIMAEEYDYGKLAEFRERYVSVDKENCTEKLGDFLYGIIKEKNQKLPEKA